MKPLMLQATKHGSDIINLEHVVDIEGWKMQPMTNSPQAYRIDFHLTNSRSYSETYTDEKEWNTRLAFIYARMDE